MRKRERQTKRNSIFMICLIRLGRGKQPESKHIFSSVAKFPFFFLPLDIDGISSEKGENWNTSKYTYIQYTVHFASQQHKHNK